MPPYRYQRAAPVITSASLAGCVYVSIAFNGPDNSVIFQIERCQAHRTRGALPSMLAWDTRAWEGEKKKEDVGPSNPVSVHLPSLFKAHHSHMAPLFCSSCT